MLLQYLSKVLIRRRAYGTGRHIYWYCKADANKDILLGWIHQGSNDADHMAITIKQRAA